MYLNFLSRDCLFFYSLFLRNFSLFPGGSCLPGNDCSTEIRSFGVDGSPLGRIQFPAAVLDGIRDLQHRRASHRIRNELSDSNDLPTDCSFSCVRSTYQPTLPRHSGDSRLFVRVHASSRYASQCNCRYPRPTEDDGHGEYSSTNASFRDVHPTNSNVQRQEFIHEPVF